MFLLTAYKMNATKIHIYIRALAFPQTIIFSMKTRISLCFRATLSAEVSFRCGF